MDKQHKDSNQPLVGQVAEHYQEDRKSMVQSVFEEISLRTDEHMPEESTEVLAKLSDVEHFHLEGDIGYSRKVLSEGIGASKSAEPSGHKVGADEYLVGPGRADKVVDDGVAPLD